MEKTGLHEDNLQSAVRIFNDVLNHRGIRSYRLNITSSDDDELPPLVYEKFCSADVSVVRDAQKACLQALARGASDAVLDTMMFRVSPMERILQVAPWTGYDDMRPAFAVFWMLENFGTFPD